MNSRAKRFAKFLVLFLVFAPLFIFIGGEIVLHLWNWLAPAVFGLKTITFWQAVGLLILCRILFGGHGGNFRRRGSDWRHRIKERFEHMPPDVREAMLNRIAGKHQGPAAPNEAKA